MRNRTSQSRRTEALTAAAVALVALSSAFVSSTRAAHQFSFESADDVTVGPTTYSGGINPVHQNPVISEPNAYIWGDSYQASPAVDHSQSTLFVTDGAHSMKMSQPLNGYTVGNQILYNNDGVHNAKFADLGGSTKMLMDITTPAHGPNYQTLDVHLNFGGGADGSGAYHYMSAYNGNYYQFVDGNPGGASTRTTAATQTLTWDFGGQMQTVFGQLWPDLGGYNIIHMATGNGGAATGDPAPSATSDYYLDNIRFVNEDTTAHPTWQKVTTANWTDSANWANGVPNAAGAPAIFYGIGAGTGTTDLNATVTVNSAVTVGSIIFDSQRTSFSGEGASNSITSNNDLAQIVNYTLSGTGGLTLDNGTSEAEIYAIAGSHTIGVPVTVNSNLSIDTSAGFIADNNGSLPGGGRHSFVNPTSLTFGSTITLAAGKTLTTHGAGTVTFTAIRGSGGLVVNGGKSIIAAGGAPNSPGGASTVTSLAIAPSAKLDLTNNSFVIDYTNPVGTLVNGTRLMLLNGQLTSSSADASRKLGYGDNAGLNIANFAGLTPDTSSILIKFTYSGDANLDGQVDVGDLGSLATNYGLAAPWTGGDFNYDGNVDVGDLGTLATNYGLGVGAPLGSGASDVAQPTASAAAVPEPTTMSALLLGVTLIGARRRRQVRSIV